MPRVSIVTLDKAKDMAAVADHAAKVFLDGDQHPLHLRLHELAPGQVLRLEQSAVDRVVYVWEGGVAVGDCTLAKGSSAIVEHARSLDIVAGDQSSRLLVFAAASPVSQRRAGGHVHLLPAERVPRAEPTQPTGVSGAMHADSSCPTCELWLHENHFPGRDNPSREDAERGIHSHTEDEIIFIIAGQMRLGSTLVGPGTALAIRANTLYSFTPGPDGLSFINFRAAMPGDIRFANGGSMSETGYWRDIVSRPQYVDVADDAGRSFGGH